MNGILNSINLMLENMYAKALFTFLVFMFIISIVMLIYRRYIKSFAKKTKNKVDDVILEKSERPIMFILILIGIKLSIRPLNIINSSINNGIDTFVILIITYVVSSFVNTVIDIWGRKFAESTKSTLDDEILPLFHSFSRVIIWVIALIMVLDTWSIKIGPLLASLGIAGLAVAFALQNTLGNIFGGIALILDKNFKVGEVILLDSGEKGKIIDVGLRSTKLRTFDNELLIVPNGQLSNSKIRNIAKPNNILRVVMPVGVAYGSDIDKVKRVLMNTLEGVEGILEDDEDHEPKVRFVAMNDFSLDFKLIFYIEDYSEKFRISDEVNTKIYKDLNKNKIEIPFPTRTLYMKKE